MDKVVVDGDAVETDVVDEEMDVEVNEGVVSAPEFSLTKKPITIPITSASITTAIPRPILAFFERHLLLESSLAGVLRSVNVC